MSLLLLPLYGYDVIYFVFFLSIFLFFRSGDDSKRFSLSILVRNLGRFSHPRRKREGLSSHDACAPVFSSLALFVLPLLLYDLYVLRLIFVLRRFFFYADEEACLAVCSWNMASKNAVKKASSRAVKAQRRVFVLRFTQTGGR